MDRFTSPPPPELLTAYKQYKQDTEFIAAWLAKTAIQHRLRSSDAYGSVDPSTRLKASLPSISASDAQPRGSDFSQQQRPIKTSEFVLLAKQIASVKPKITIPDALSQRLVRAIKARRKATEWYQTNGHDPDSDDRHAYFTNILNVAWSILHPQGRRNRGKPVPKTSRMRMVPAPVEFVDTFSAKSANNRFASLFFQGLDFQQLDTEAAFEADAHIYAHTAAERIAADDLKPIPSIIVRDERDIEDEFFFAMIQFFQDLGKVRDYLRGIWELYRKSEIELGFASLLTNTAIHLIRRAENEFEQMVERPKQYPANVYPAWTIPAIFLHQVYSPTITLEQLVNPATFKPIKGVSSQHEFMCCWDAYCALMSSLNSVQRLGLGELVSPVQSKNQKPSDRTFQIGQMISCLHACILLQPDSLTPDEITRGVKIALQTGTIPMWASFGLHVSLEIRSWMGDRANIYALEELQYHTEQAMVEYSRRTFSQLRFTRDNPAAIQSMAAIEQILGSVQRDAFEDQIGQAIRHAAIQRPELKSLCEEDHNLLRLHPVRCGMIKYDLFLKTHLESFNYERSWQGLHSMIYVYMACRQLFPDDPGWPDLELFIDRQDQVRIFGGGRPTSFEETVRKFFAGMGIDPSHSSFDLDYRAEYPTSAHPGMLNARGLLAKINQRWYHRKDDNEDVEEWLSEVIAAVRNPKSGAELIRRARPLKPRVVNCRAELAKPNPKIESILNRLALHYIAETPEIYFDCLGLQQTCAEMWQDIVEGMEWKYSCPFETVPQAVFYMFNKARLQMIVDNDLRVRSAHTVGFFSQAWDVIRTRCRRQYQLGPDHEVFRSDNDPPFDQMALDPKLADNPELNSHLVFRTGDQQTFWMMHKNINNYGYPDLRMFPTIRGLIYHNWPLNYGIFSAVWVCHVIKDKQRIEAEKGDQQHQQHQPHQHQHQQKQKQKQKQK